MIDAAEAIRTLQQFERLDDYQVDEIVGVIERQGRALSKASEWIADHTGTCPIALDYTDWTNCDVVCTTEDDRHQQCWRKYLEEEA